MTDTNKNYNIYLMLKRFVKTKEFSMGAALVMLLVIGTSFNPNFLSPMNIGNIVSITAILAMATAGQTMVMVSGAGVDISIGAMMSLGAILTVQLQQRNDAMILPSLIIILLAGAIFGLLNGMGSILAKVPSLVMTFAMSRIIYNVQMIYTGGSTQGRPAPSITFIGTRRIFPWLPWLAVVLFVVTVLMILILNNSVFGKHIYASGSNESAARLAGIKTKRVQILTFVFSGMFSGFAGFWFAAHNTFTVVSGAEYLNLPALAAVLIGGVSFAGGKGSFKGALLGALILTIVTSILVMVRASAAMRQIIYGVILIFLLFMYNREPAIQQ